MAPPLPPLRARARRILSRTLAAGAGLLTACGGPAPATRPAQPGPDPVGGKSCKAVSNPLEPSLVAWNAGDRNQLAALRAQGVVAVRYSVRGCNVELEVLPGCIGKGVAYAFTPSPTEESSLVTTEQQLFAELPLGAASLSGRLKGRRALRTDYRVVGVAALPADRVFQREDLAGPDCARATHVVARVHLGGFAMANGTEESLRASASFFGLGGGVEQTSSASRMFSHGNPAACERSANDGKEDPLCAVPLRVGLLPLGAAAAPTKPPVAPPAPPAPPPAAGTRGPATVRVPAGSFEMGSTSGDDDEKPVHRAAVAAFELDRTEVTVAHYRECVRGGGSGCSAPATGDDCNWDKPGRANHPVNCVDWHQASGYCAWAGKRLPTETEWEYAARGTDGRQHPWDPAEAGAVLCWNRSGGQGTCEVGSFPAGASPFGALDLAGNVWEWTASSYCDYPAKTCGNAARVVRGGGWNAGGLAYFRSSSRHRREPGARSAVFGFRCAR